MKNTYSTIALLLAALVVGQPVFAEQTVQGTVRMDQKGVPTSAELRQRNAALLDKIERRREAIHKADLALLKRHEKIMAREERAMSQDEALLKRKARDLARFERVLATWERQQTEYQKYLDSLKIK